MQSEDCSLLRGGCLDREAGTVTIMVVGCILLVPGCFCTSQAEAGWYVSLIDPIGPDDIHQLETLVCSCLNPPVVVHASVDLFHQSVIVDYVPSGIWGQYVVIA